MGTLAGLRATLDRKLRWRRSCSHALGAVIIDASGVSSRALRESLVSWENQTEPIGKVIVCVDASSPSSEVRSLIRARFLLPLEVKKSATPGRSALRQWIDSLATGVPAILARGDVYYDERTIQQLIAMWDEPGCCAFSTAVMIVGAGSCAAGRIPSWGLEYYSGNRNLALASGGIALSRDAARLIADSDLSAAEGIEEPLDLRVKRLLLSAGIPVKAVGDTPAAPRFTTPASDSVPADADVRRMVCGNNLDADPEFRRLIAKPYRGRRGNVLLMAGQGDLNGANIALLEMYRHLSAMGEQVIAVLPAGGPFEDVLQAEHLPYFNLGIGAFQWVSPLYYTEEEEEQRKRDWIPPMERGTALVRQIIAGFSIDLVHENTSGSYMAAAAAEQEGIARVWHMREFNEEDHGQHLWLSMDPYRHFAESDACICISKAIYRKYAQCIGDEDNLHLIYDGISIADYLDKGHAAFCDPSRVTIACAGRVCAGKGQKLLVQAIALLPEEIRKRIKVRIVGSLHDDEYVHEIEELLEDEDIADIVRFDGVLIDMRAVWGETDIAVVPSRFEAFGRCAVEAMLAGCLVVGNDSAGTSEVIDDGATGFLFARDDADSLARRIVEVLADPDRARSIAVAGRVSAQERFSSERNAREVFDLHQQIMAKRSIA